MSNGPSIQHAVILAAGRGSRMYPLTEAIPKPMAPFRGGTLISHGIGSMKRNGLDIHITVGYKRAALAQYVVEFGVDTVINTEGHSNSWFLYHSLISHIDEAVLVMTCDNVTELDLPALMDNYESLGRPPCMVVPVVPVPGIDGDYIRHESHVITSLSRNVPSDIYCSGIQILNPVQVRRLAPNEGDFMTVWRQLIACRKLYCSSVYPHSWLSIDTLDDLARAEKAPAGATRESSASPVRTGSPDGAEGRAQTR